jgi:hypothetical protein
MAPPKQANLLSSMGFSDPDLKTPRHDAIVAWVSENAEQLFPDPGVRFDFRGNEYTPDSLLNNVAGDLRSLVANTIVEHETDIRRWSKTETRVEWEYQVFERWKSGRGRPVGFVDLRVQKRARLIRLHPRTNVSIETSGYYCVSSGLKYECRGVLTTEEMAVLGVEYRQSRQIVEIVGIGVDSLPCRLREWWVEVKSSIVSAGELFRQMSAYRSNAHDNQRLCVASPDARFKSLIEQQGYHFIGVPAEVANASRA